MIVVGPQLPLLYPLVDPNQQVPGDVLAIIHTWGGEKEVVITAGVSEVSERREVGLWSFLQGRIRSFTHCSLGLIHRRRRLLFAISYVRNASAAFWEAGSRLASIGVLFFTVYQVVFFLNVIFKRRLKRNYTDVKIILAHKTQ